MTQQNLQKIFESEFNWNSWKEVMNFTFPEFKFNLVQSDLTRDTKAHNKSAGHIKEHGNTTLLSAETLTLCEVLVKDNVRLDRNIKSVRSLVADLAIPNYQTIIAVFHNADNTKWRFTLVVKEFTDTHKIIDKKPDSYTYVFGVGEQGRTASERFLKLANTQKKTLKDLEEAFSVEALSKKFFREYRDLYKRFVEDITNSKSKLALFKETTQEKQEKSARDFVKRMMGRIVFLYFLQKKGWLGCTTKWKDGDEQFMKSFVQKAKQNELFYHNYLEPLFFDTLNERRAKHDEDCIIQRTNFGKVPYLNGGLFEKDENHPKGLTLKWEIFEEFFETLNNYNFTIIEDDPEFKEVAVDPEMLGHIFENMLEDNKDKGTFYTPKEIVHYMCQESLFEYLKTYLIENKHWSQDGNDANEKALYRFVKQKLASGIIEYDKPLSKALRDVKICDPAIGSGAFPMGLLNEIYHCVHKLHDESPDSVGDVWGIGRIWEGNKVKLNIIQNSIYGVDIEKGAVDIARLRFWLSLIVDDPTPTPLPNLEYKIVVGNSLISKLGEDFIDIDWTASDTSHGLFGGELADKKRKLLQKISAEQKESFNPESDKKKLAKDIRNLKIDLLINQLELMVTTKGIHKKPTGSGKSISKQTELYLQTISWKESIKRLTKLKSNPSLPLNFFDWKLDFPEILNPLFKENGGLNSTGFDIVIGNPPYVDIKGLPEEDVKLYFNTFLTAQNRINLYAIFIEKATSLLSISGSLSFIIPNSMLMSSSYEKLRRLIGDKINYIIKLPDAIFENAIVETIVFQLSNGNKKEIRGKVYPNDIRTNLKNIDFDTFEFLDWQKDSEFRFNIFQKKDYKQILAKINDNRIKLLEVADFSLGLTPYDKYKGHTENTIKQRIYHSKTRINSDYKPLISGANIKRFYVSETSEEFIKYGDWLGAPREERFFTHPRLIVRQILSGEPKRIYCGYTEQSLYFTQVGFGIIAKSENEYNYSNFILLGILNSKLMNFYHNNVFLDTEKEVFQKILIANCKNFPLPRLLSNSVRGSIEIKAKTIFNLKLNAKETDTLESELDNEIYKIYDLNEDDIAVIERAGSV